MSDIFTVSCDESCHLENDHQKVMVLGEVWCPDYGPDFGNDIIELE
jgi:hypothetical protein